MKLKNSGASNAILEEAVRTARVGLRGSIRVRPQVNELHVMFVRECALGRRGKQHQALSRLGWQGDSMFKRGMDSGM